MNRYGNKAVITAFLVLVAPMTGAQDSVVSSHPMIGERAPVFDLAEVGGDTVSLESLKGRYVVLHFGASW